MTQCGNTRRYTSLTCLPTPKPLLVMKTYTDKIIAVIDRILWASQMASLTSPTYWGRSVHGDETSPWLSAVRANEEALRKEEERRQAERHQLAHA